MVPWKVNKSGIYCLARKEERGFIEGCLKWWASGLHWETATISPSEEGKQIFLRSFWIYLSKCSLPHLKSRSDLNSHWQISSEFNMACIFDVRLVFYSRSHWLTCFMQLYNQTSSCTSNTISYIRFKFTQYNFLPVGRHTSKQTTTHPAGLPSSIF